MKNFFTREVKIGLIFVITVAILFFGLNFLKGINIFTPSNHYFAKYKDIGGLVVSNPVMIKGYKVGQVRQIQYNFAEEKSFLVEISVNEDVRLPKGTVLTLADEGLMGGKIINIDFGREKSSYNSGDTIESNVASGDFMSQISEFTPKIEAILTTLDSTLLSVKTLVNSPSLQNSITRFDKITADLNIAMAQLKASTANLPQTMKTLDNITTNLDKKISDLDIATLTAKINGTLANLQSFSEKLNSKNSSLGLLLNDRSVYDNLNTTVQSANSLLIDLKQNPKRYVHFSVFGKSEKPPK